MRMRRSMRGTAAIAVLAIAVVAGCGNGTPEALVASAKAYLAKNDRNAAVIELKNALQKNPDLAEARFLLGKALLESGDLAAAEKELQRAAALGYPFDQVAPALARTMVARGDYRKAVDEFGKAEVTSPQSKADLQSALGLAWLATGNDDAARSAFAAAVAAVPGYPPALLGNARLLAVGGDLPGAAALVEGALTKSPNFADAWQYKGDLAAAQARLDDALAAYRKALEIRPESVLNHAKIVAMLLRQGNAKEASKALEAMTKIAPKHPQTLYLQALTSFQEKNYSAARDAIAQQLRAAGDNVLGLTLSANIDLRLGAYAQAEASLQKVLQQVPNDRFAGMMLVSTFLRSGQPARALNALKPLLEAGSEDSDVQALAGEVYTYLGDNAQAGRYFAKAAALDPKSSAKRAVLAMSHVATGASEQGLRELQEAAAADTGTRADLALIAFTTRQRNFDAALEAIAVLEKKQPDSPLPHNMRGGVLAAKGDMAGARKSFERAASMDAANFTAASGLAQLDLADKKPDDAKRRYEVVLAKDPKNTQALLAIAELRAKAGAPADEVAALIGKAVAADPENTAPRLALIAYYIRIKEPKKAVAAAQDALAVMPDRAELLYAAGQAQQAAGEPNQAAKSFGKLARVRPGSPLPYMKEAEAQVANKEYDAALQSLRKALALKPDLLEAQRGMMHVYLAQDKVGEALAVSGEVQRQRPKEAVGYIFEGEIHVSRKAWPEAAAAYRKGLARVATTDLAARTVTALRMAGNAAEADKVASTWMKQHPKDIDFRGYLAESALRSGDYATAAKEYKAVLETRPDDPFALNNLAWVAGQLKDPKAIEYAQKADRLAPENPAILDTLGALLVEKGELKRGIDALQRATALAPDAPFVRLNLARALAKDGQKDAAKKELDVLAKLGDKFPAQAEVTKLKQEL